MADKRPALGRGLSALIPDLPVTPASGHPSAAAALGIPQGHPAAAAALGGTPPPPAREAPTELDLDLLIPNRHQPRTEMGEPKLDELARSIKTSGVIQPILVRRAAEGKFEIIAGERRWRAAQRAGLLRVPVIVREADDNKMLELALIENIQRENLNPIEEGTAYKRLADEYGLTQEDIAAAVGKDRATVANYQRLLNLPAEVRSEVASGALTMGHARALLGLADQALQRRAAREIRARDLSVRETEALVRKLTSTALPRKPPEQPDVHTRAAEDRLRFALGTRVRIVRKGKGGRIEIDFASEEELQRLYTQLTEA